MRAAEFVESYFDAWNHCDPLAVADHLTTNGIYLDVPAKAQRNHDELVVYLRDFFSTYRHRYELIGEILASNDTIAFQYRMYPVGKAGKELTDGVYNGAEFVTLHGDAAISITDYYEVLSPGRRADITRRAGKGMERRKYAKSGLGTRQMAAYQNRLERIMQSQKLFLNSDMTLPKLAEAVNCSVNHLSQVINAGFGMSFFDYLNRYRIAYAKQLLNELDARNTAILNIAYTVGFNSNSAFYAAFKKCVGKTPAQYRKTRQRISH